MRYLTYNLFQFSIDAVKSLRHCLRQDNFPLAQARKQGRLLKTVVSVESLP